MIFRFPLLLSFFLLLTKALVADIVINELHIDEADKTKQTEFIELFNSSDQAVDVSGWFFSSGIDYVIPAQTSIPVGEYLVIARDPATIQAEFNYSQALGPWMGKLSNEGETVTLRDSSGSKMDEVDYQLGFPWPTYGDEPSPSIELINPILENSLGGNWRSASSGNSSSVPPTSYILRGDSQWSYRKGTSFPVDDDSGKKWTENNYDPSVDGQWIDNQTAPFGYGDNDDATVLSDMRNNYLTFFMRHEFTIAPGQVPETLTLRALYDDSLVVFINGQEVRRFNIGVGAIPFPPPSNFVTEHEARNEFEEVTLNNAASYLVEGVNTISVQLINISLTSSDATADIELVHVGGTPPAEPSPGQANSVLASNAPPVTRKVAHSPQEPSSADDVTITAQITDAEGVESVTLDYQIVSPGDYIKIDDPRYQVTWTSLAMLDDGTNGDLVANDDIFTVTLPASLQAHRHLVRYRINSIDNLGASVRVPYADDPSPNFTYFVYDSLPTWTGKETPSDPNITYDFNTLPDLQKKVPIYQLITTRSEHVNAQHIPGSTRSSGYTGSDYLWQGTLVYNGDVYDHIRFRARGGVWRYAMGKNMWKFDFNRGHSFQAYDNYGKKYDTTWNKLNFSSVIQQKFFGQRGEQGLYESVGFRLFDLAGSEACNTNYVHFRIIENEDENGPTNSQFDSDFQGLYLAIEQMDGRYLDEHKLPDGNLYKMEAGTGDLNNQGPNQPTDKSDLNDFLAAQDSPQSEQWWRDNFDLERYYAYRIIVEGIRHYDINFGKNYFYFNNPESQKWQVHSWDLDVAWSNGGNGSGNEPFNRRVLGISNLRKEYRNATRHVHDLLFNSEQTDLLIDEQMQFVWEKNTPSYIGADRAMWDYNPILISDNVNPSRAGHGEFYLAAAQPSNSYEGMAQKMRNYVSSRAQWVRSNILTDTAQIPRKPTLTYTGITGFPSNSIFVDSSAYSSPSGSGFSAMEYRVAEITDSSSSSFDPAQARKYEIEEDWASGELTIFTSRQKIPTNAIKPGRTYRARVRHKDQNEQWSHWSDPVQFVASAPDVVEYQQNLMITEIMFNPPEPQGTETNTSIQNDDYEWIELTNIGLEEIDLTDVRFTKGVDFDFLPGTTLAGGASILIVKDEAAFIARYGSGLPIAGNYGNDNLSNGGERLKLSFGAGITIHDLTYSNAAPWPVIGAGSKTSIVLQSPNSAPDHAIATNWRANIAPLGTPSTQESNGYAAWKIANSITDNNADEDGDGIPNLIEYLLMGDPRSTTDSDLALLPQGVISSVDVAGEIDDYFTFSFNRLTDTSGLRYEVQYSEQLDSWNSAIFLSFSTGPNDLITEVWRTPLPISDKSIYFMRLSASEIE